MRNISNELKQVDELTDTRKNSNSDRINKFEGGSGVKPIPKQVPQIEFQSGMSEDDSVETENVDNSRTIS